MLVETYVPAGGGGLPKENLWSDFLDIWYYAGKKKLFGVVENSIEQFCAAHIVQCCQQYCSALLHLTEG